MLRPFSAIVLAATLAAPLVAPGSDKPTEFSSAACKFKAKFPGTPKEQSQMAAGVQMKMFATESRNGVFAVSVADMPIPANEPAEKIDERLDGAQAGVIKNVNGTLKDSKKVKLADKYAGRDFTATISKPMEGLIRARVYLVGKRLYQVMVMGTEDFVKSKDADQFFESFALTE